MSTDVQGIPCELASPEMRLALEMVLCRIAESFPEDAETIGQVVLAVKPVSKDEVEDGTRGEWKRLHETPDNPASRQWWFVVPAPGTLYLLDAPCEHAVAIVAHELGHAVSIYDHLEDRGECPDEWASELTADWHAHRWGFGKEIEAMHQGSDFAHHGPRPGGWTEETMNGRTFRYTVGDDFTVSCDEVKPERRRRVGKK